MTTNMTQESLLAALNLHPHLSQVGLVPLAELAFTEAEQAFLQTHRPEQVLVVYGTLAPGRPNYHIMEPVGGQWRNGRIKGLLAQQGWGADLGYPGFKHTSLAEQTDIEVVVLFSEQLVAHWARLDAFEGEGYQRILTPFKLENGEVGVGFIYAVRET
jgi:gamma-glutamylcyclotransferase (GGCT)/AIG2-like uncharacterized protein YtfP